MRISTHFSRLLSGFSFLTALFLAFPASAQIDSARANQLQYQLDYLLDLKNLKGLSASVIIPGEGTWNGVSGVSYGSVLIDTGMVFGIGSVTKNFTATAILMLQQDGLLSIDDSLHQYLATYPNINPNITIKQLLQHRSGIYNYTESTSWGNAVNANPGVAMHPDTLLNNYIHTPTSAPGVTYRYSNTNFLLLGLIIEEITGQPYHTFIRNRMLDPHQLNSFYMGAQEPAFGVMPHNWSDPDLNGSATDIYGYPLTAVWGTSAADGALIGTAHDLARYGQKLFNGEILQDSSLQLMTQFMPASGGINGYGLGLMRYPNSGDPAWGHGGNIAGYAACLAYSPSDSIVVAILANQDVIGSAIALSLLNKARQLLVTGVADTENTDVEFSCFPNPVKGTGTIRYLLQKPQQLQIKLLNTLGQEVRMIENKTQQAGEHTLQFNITDLPAGMYLCVLKTEDRSVVKRWIIQH